MATADESSDPTGTAASRPQTLGEQAYTDPRDRELARLKDADLMAALFMKALTPAKPLAEYGASVQARYVEAVRQAIAGACGNEEA